MRPLSDNILIKINDWNRNCIDNNQSFKIDIVFKTGRCGNAFIYFDSVISHMTAQYVLGEDFYNLSIDHDERFNLHIPVKKYHHRDYYFYYCGGIFDIPDRVNYWTKRFEKHCLDSVDANKIIKKQGAFKSYKMPILYNDQRRYTIYGIGNIELLNKIWQSKYHIGKKSAIGFGECEMHISECAIKDILIIGGELMRPLPVSYFKNKNLNCEKTIMPIAPPYYGCNSKEIECYVPGTI